MMCNLCARKHNELAAMFLGAVLLKGEKLLPSL
jgi:hypothetical protein